MKPFSSEENDYIREHYGKKTYEQIGSVLQRPAWQIKWRAHGMGLPWPKTYSANNQKDNAYMKKVQEELS